MIAALVLRSRVGPDELLRHPSVVEHMIDLLEEEARREKRERARTSLKAQGPGGPGP